MKKEFWQELQTFEEERKVTYVTNAERFGFERGVQEGLRNKRSLILRLPIRRIGDVFPELRSASATKVVRICRL